MDVPPIDTSGGNILQLPIKPSDRRDSKLFLVPPARDPCSHYLTQFEVDTVGGKCKCLGCGTEVSPMFVLERLMQQESQWQRNRAAYLGELARLAERSKTKCTHCGKITRISRG